MSHPKYIMESATEGDRLEQKTDPNAAAEQLRLVGLLPGMRALDAGAGTGAVARVMARMVGPEGSVVAFDASETRLAQGKRIARREGIANLSFQAGDLLAPPLEPASFDFVWSRFVFEYLPGEEGRIAMERLIGLLKPGGTLAVGDLDGNMLFHDGMDPQLEEELNKVVGGLVGSFDPFVGRKLYGRFFHRGFREIRVHCAPYHLYPGPIPEEQMANWRAKFVTIRTNGVEALGSAERYDRFVARFLAFLRREDTFTYSTLFLVSGRKP